jgi:transposase-like protein
MAAAETPAGRRPDPRRPAGPDKTREWKQARAIEMHQQGETTRTISAELGVAKATVNRWLAPHRQPVPANPVNEGTPDA